MPKTWTPDDVMQTAWAFQNTCVLAAAAELGLFDQLAGGGKTAEQLAAALGTDLRGTTVLADALTAMELLTKTAGQYAPAGGVAGTLTEGGEKCVLHLVRHLANCMRSWSQLAHVVQTGKPAERPVSIRGSRGDHESFIQAMNDISVRSAAALVPQLGPPRFAHVLDVGGASGTWTIELLRGCPRGRATLFDLPDVIPMARERLAAEGLLDRVTLAAGDFGTDDLPGGCDLAWVCAIVHMLDRPGCRALYAKVHAALADGGRILVRDVVMNDDHTQPPRGALFAVNMLTANPGGTYSFAETAEDLRTAGFVDVKLVRESEFMDGVVEGRK